MRGRDGNRGGWAALALGRPARHLGGMSEPAPTVPVEDQDERAFRAAVAQAMADEDAGRTIPYEDVRRWLLSWGTDNELPPPRCG